MDVTITYHSFAEYFALQQGVVERVDYAWRDHFMLVGEITPELQINVLMPLQAQLQTQPSLRCPVKNLSMAPS